MMRRWIVSHKRIFVFFTHIHRSRHLPSSLFWLLRHRHSPRLRSEPARPLVSSVTKRTASTTGSSGTTKVSPPPAGGTVQRRTPFPIERCMPSKGLLHDHGLTRCFLDWQPRRMCTTRGIRRHPAVLPTSTPLRLGRETARMLRDFTPVRYVFVHQPAVVLALLLEIQRLTPRRYICVPPWHFQVRYKDPLRGDVNFQTMMAERTEAEQRAANPKPGSAPGCPGCRT